MRVGPAGSPKSRRVDSSDRLPKGEELYVETSIRPRDPTHRGVRRWGDLTKKCWLLDRPDTPRHSDRPKALAPNSGCRGTQRNSAAVLLYLRFDILWQPRTALDPDDSCHIWERLSVPNGSGAPLSVDANALMRSATLKFVEHPLLEIRLVATPSWPDKEP